MVIDKLWYRYKFCDSTISYNDYYSYQLVKDGSNYFLHTVDKFLVSGFFCDLDYLGNNKYRVTETNLYNELVNNQLSKYMDDPIYRTCSEIKTDNLRIKYFMSKWR